MVKGLVLLIVFWCFPAQLATSQSQQALPCSLEDSLEAFIVCVLDAMPRADTEGFMVPDPALEPAWEDVVAMMRAGQCNSGDLPMVLADAGYVLTDFSRDAASYCILYEASDSNLDGRVDRGWGTFIVNLQPKRLVDIQIPHPLNDSNTGTQGIALFENTGARAFLMAGTHRRANAAMSSCQSSFQIADAAHNTNLPFHWIAAAMQAEDSTRNVSATNLQFHGMGVSACAGVDVYLTQGTSSLVMGTAGPLFALQTALASRVPLWQVTVPGDIPSCNLSGGSNVQGRLKNGVAPDEVCTVAAEASDVSGRFIHIEQKIAFRDPLDWEAVLEDAFPEQQDVGNEQPGGVVDAGAPEVFGRVYPNPFVSHFTVSVEAHRSQVITLTVYDLLGRPRREAFEGWLSAGQTLHMQIEMADLPAGFYVLRIAGENHHHLLPLLAR